jgi:hypothetical protein
MNDEELAALEAAAYARELELEYMERQEVSKAFREIIDETTWETTNGAF